MKYLIDTCTFVWLSIEPKKLSNKAFKVIENPKNEILVSVVSAWELAIKKGNIVKTDDLEKFVKQSCLRHNLTLVSPKLSNVCKIKGLPFHHKDPFDRLLIATALDEGCPIITSDTKIPMYKIKVIW